MREKLNLSEFHAFCIVQVKWISFYTKWLPAAIMIRPNWYQSAQVSVLRVDFRWFPVKATLIICLDDSKSNVKQNDTYSARGQIKQRTLICGPKRLPISKNQKNFRSQGGRWMTLCLLRLASQWRRVFVLSAAMSQLLISNTSKNLLYFQTPG